MEQDGPFVGVVQAALVPIDAPETEEERQADEARQHHQMAARPEEA